MTTHTQVEAKSKSTSILAMQPTHSGLLPQQEQEDRDRSLLSSDNWQRSPSFSSTFTTYQTSGGAKCDHWSFQMVLRSETHAA